MDGGRGAVEGVQAGDGGIEAIENKEVTLGVVECGECGDTLSLAMKLNGWTYFKTYQKLAGRLRHQPKGIVYVLVLADDCYYIGYTLDLPRRLTLHFNGQGAHWTKQHPPLKLAVALATADNHERRTGTRR